MIPSNKELNTDNPNFRSGLEQAIKNIEKTSKEIDWKHVGKMALIGYSTFLFVLYTTIITIRSAFSLF
jgi:hypothetical protein